MSATLRYFATAARGLVEALEQELAGLGARDLVRQPGGVSFSGTLELGYAACLWSRVAGRVLLEIAAPRDDVSSPDALYELARQVSWDEHLADGRTFCVDVSGKSRAFDSAQFAALRVKDAVVDQRRAQGASRPRVDTDRPDVRLHVHLGDDRALVAVDLSGAGLHRRGYRDAKARAPLRETLAAALLLMAEWPEHRAAGRPFVDPMCGSGTLVIEAALMAADVAPGLLREPSGFLRWAGHQPALWRRLLDEASERDRRGEKPRRLGCGPIVGRDIDDRALRGAEQSAARAELQKWVSFERVAIDEGGAPRAHVEGGLLLTNPPYGQRLGHSIVLERLYLELGDALRQRFRGWRAFVLSGERTLSACIGLRATRRHRVFNGAIECRLLDYPISDQARGRPRNDDGPFSKLLPLLRSGAQSESFANRLRKNEQGLARWAEQADVECYRVYDSDIPEYAVSVDRYGRRLCVSEYAAPRTVDAADAEARLHDAVLLAAEVLGVRADDVYVKVRRRQRGSEQYQRMAQSNAFFVVREGMARFRVNLADYLDSGLFLDHRDVRAYLSSRSEGKRFLNLFSNTGAASVYAALGGAKSTTSVDLSNTYQEWARENFALNRIAVGDAHRLEREDCMRFVEQAARRDQRFELIFCNPPSFSNSKSMRETFDVKRDHGLMLRALAELLTRSGEIIFATHARRFRLDTDALSGKLEHQELSLVPRDFARKGHTYTIFRLWRG